MIRFAIILSCLLALILVAVTASAQAQCQAERLEQFLEERAFELSADEKIDLYADQLVRYYDKQNVSRREVLRSMKAWERRWPERIYKFISIIEFRRTEAGDACKVKFAYRFLAYSPPRDKVSAGVGTSTLVLADVGDGGRFKIIGEIGSVKCRGLKKFARSRC
ncbi:MAG: hypothetical protein JXQ99_18340 [Hyphomicrobiaceae bacterium]